MIARHDPRTDVTPELLGTPVTPELYKKADEMNKNLWPDFKKVRDGRDK
jgi:hypothetical protein